MEIDFIYLCEDEDFNTPDVQDLLSNGGLWDFASLDISDVLDNFSEGKLCQVNKKSAALFLEWEDDGDGFFQCVLRQDLTWSIYGKAILEEYVRILPWFSISSRIHKDDTTRRAAFLQSNFKEAWIEGEFTVFSYDFSSFFKQE